MYRVLSQNSKLNSTISKTAIGNATASKYFFTSVLLLHYLWIHVRRAKLGIYIKFLYDVACQNHQNWPMVYDVIQKITLFWT